MIEEKVSNTWSQAEELFQSAETEFARPEEDVVPYMVCRNAYKAVDKFLTGYLLKHGIEIHNNMTLEVLLDLCRDIDPKFKDLNLDPLMVSNQTGDLWMNLDTVKDFITLAGKTRSMVGH